MAARFRDLDQFNREVLRGRSGPMASPAEEIADEIYQQDYIEELDSLWDSHDPDDD